MDVLEQRIQEIRGRSERCYLNTAAMSLVPLSVQEAVQEFYESRARLGPDFSAYWEHTDTLRALVAEKISCSPREIMFVQNTSMGINLASGAIPFEPGDNVVTTDMEFPSNIYPWVNLAQHGVETRFAENREGSIRLEDIEALCDSRTRAVSISWVQAANGFVSDLKTLGTFCRQRNIYFVVDAIQGLGVLPIDLSELKVDILVSGFFKWLLGPDGLAFVYIRENILEDLRVPVAGWAGMRNKFDYSVYRYDLIDNASRFETGNLNFSAIAGAVRALQFTQGIEEDIYRRVSGLKALLREKLLQVDGVQVLSPNQEVESGILYFTLPGAKQAHGILTKQGIVTTFREGIRVSVHFYNTQEDVKRLVDGCRCSN